MKETVRINLSVSFSIICLFIFPYSMGANPFAIISFHFYFSVCFFKGFEKYFFFGKFFSSLVCHFSLIIIFYIVHCFYKYIFKFSTINGLQVINSLQYASKYLILLSTLVIYLSARLLVQVL